MPMSEAQTSRTASPAALVHAAEVAQWIVLLLAWLYLGEQGMRLGWSVASGVLPVALWWAVRLLCRGSAWVRRWGATELGVLGLLSAAGLALPLQLDSPAAAHAALLLLALVWGVWCALLETRNTSSTFQLGKKAWHPLLAVSCVLAAWRLSGDTFTQPWVASFLLGLSAAALCARACFDSDRAWVCKGPRASLHHLLSPAAMGLMMGSLWLGNGWCVGLGVSNSQMVWVHLALMAGLPSAVAFMLGGRGPQWLSPQAQLLCSLCFLSMGALALTGSNVWQSWLGMLLPSLAWALHCNRQRTPQGQASGMPAWLTRTVALVLGPAALVWVGHTSASQGPWALQSVLMVLGAMAASQALSMTVQHRDAPRSLTVS
jgi:hypothetical protein